MNARILYAGIIAIACFLLSPDFCQAQGFGIIYCGISSDSIHGGHRLEFKNDTILELSSFPRHMSQQFRLTLTYKKIGDALEIYYPNISKNDSIGLVNNGFTQYLKKTTVRVEGKALIDELNNLAFLPSKDFKKKYDIIYLIDGKAYRQKTGMPNTYGTITSRTKRNRALENKMNSLKDNLENYDMKIYKGLEAYERSSHKNIFCFIELKLKT